MAGDDLFGSDDEHDPGADEFVRHGSAIQELVNAYLDEHDIADSAGCMLMLNGAITMRMIAYALETDKPSASGLKLDLDRFRREIDEALRSARKGADEFIENMKTELAAARAEDEAEGGER